MKKTSAGLIRSTLFNIEAFIAAILVLIVSINIAEAKEHLLVEITNEENPNRMTLVLETDKGNNEILYLHKDVFNNRKVRVERKTTDIKRASHQNFEKIVLEQKGKHEVVNIHSDNFALHNGGDLILDTLQNGATGRRTSYELELTRQGNTWVIKRDGKRINHIHFVSNKVALLGTVGVSKIITK